MASFVFDDYAQSMEGDASFIDFKDDTIMVRAVSDADIIPARTLSVMTTITKYSGSTDGTLASRTVGSVGARVIDCADTALGTFAQDAGKTIDSLVIYKFVTNDADSIPMIYIDLGTSATPTNNPVTIKWNASGIATLG